MCRTDVCIMVIVIFDHRCHSSCYCHIITGAAKSQDLEDNELISVAHRLTTLEMKELNERQRAEHASCMYEQQKTLFRQLEDRNFELENKFAQVGTASFFAFHVVFLLSSRSRRSNIEFLITEHKVFCPFFSTVKY